MGELGCWTYFMSIDTPANKKFKANFFNWLKTDAPGVVKKEGRVTARWCCPMTAFTSGKPL